MAPKCKQASTSPNQLKITALWCCFASFLSFLSVCQYFIFLSLSLSLSLGFLFFSLLFPFGRFHIGSLVFRRSFSRFFWQSPLKQPKGTSISEFEGPNSYTRPSLVSMATDLVNVSEFRELARRTLPKMYFDFFDGGAEDEVTLRGNVEAFKRITFRPRVLVDVTNINMSTTILGHRVSAPIMLAPSAMHQWAHPQGELATARAAAACGIIMVVSTFSSFPHEEIAADCNVTLFLQLYVSKNREITRRLVQRAEKCGYKALVLTADVPKLGRREADIRNGLVAVAPKHYSSLLTEDVHASGSKAEAFLSHVLDDSLCWKDVEWLRSITKLPVFVKGLLTAEDAGKALEFGVDGIIVSNHGGRQLDCSPAAISALEEVVQAVAGKVPVLLDGGIRRGTDVFKALALGAQAILIGRPVVFGLAAKGEEGVKKVIEMLKSELELTMALNGCCSLEAITRAHVQTCRDRLRSML